MGKQFQVHLDGNDLVQLVDGLRARNEPRQKIAKHFESGVVSDDSFIGEERRQAGEAVAIARHYSEIIFEVERKVSQQEGRS